MKKIIMLVGIIISLFSTSFAGTIQENKINDIKALSQKQDILASAIDLYLALYGQAPAGISTLKSSHLLGSAFTYNGTYSIDGVNKLIILTDTISSPETYQIDYYKNTTDMNKYSIHTVSGNSFVAKYPFTSKATYSYLLKSTSSAVVSPVPPSSPSPNTVWLNSLTKQLYFYNGGMWETLNPKKLWIVRNTSELPTSATSGEGAIVLTPTSLKKYLYVNGSWGLVPQTIPFTYNGTF